MPFEPDPELLDAYAQLVVRVGLNLQPAQPLLVRSAYDGAPLARAVAGAAWRAGASAVDVVYDDPHLKRALVAHAPDEALGAAPDWALARLRDATAAGAALLAVGGASDAALMEDLDPARVSRSRSRALDQLWLKAVGSGDTAWTIVGCPSPTWAAEALGDGDEVGRLWEAVAHALRLDAPDPAAAWAARFDELDARAAALTERRFSALRYRGPGTDLEVGLIDGVRWRSARFRTTAGTAHVANLPSEEVFTTPHKLRAEGTIASSLPLALRGGGIVEGLHFRLEGGRIVEAHADRGEELLHAELDLDEGARRLGEVALVDASSRVIDTGITFRNTLFDENATSHIAWGNGVDHSAGGPDEVNASQTHVDFMVGSDELDVDGVEPGGAVVPLLRGKRWVLEA
jgi:aminopeptidase